MNDSGRHDISSRERRHALATFLKARRGAIAPERFALPVHARRRVAGLRREEVALLCGISTTWYTQLESGAPITVSPALLSRLAEVLQLDALERAHLFALAIDELHEIVAFLPAVPNLALRITAQTFEDEIAHVLRVHRSLKIQIYGALVHDALDVLRPHLDETRCPIGYWLHDDLSPTRKRDPAYDRAAFAHAQFHREIDGLNRSSDVVGPGTYAAASTTLENAFSAWPRSLAS